jgi:hypothetical protein
MTPPNAWAFPNRPLPKKSQPPSLAKAAREKIAPAFGINADQVEL